MVDKNNFEAQNPRRDSLQQSFLAFFQPTPSISSLICPELLNVTADSCLIQSVPAYSNIFIHNKAYSSIFQPILAYLGQLKSIPACSSIFQTISAYASLYQYIPAHSSIFHPIQTISSLFKPTQAY